MNCRTFQEEIDLYLYRELSPPAAGLFETHAGSCEPCRALLDRARAVHALLDARALEPSPTLLVEARQGLMAVIETSHRPGRLWSLLFGEVGPGAPRVFALRRFAGALALVGLGFVAARVTLRAPATVGPQVLGGGVTIPADWSVSSIAPDPSGALKIGVRSTEHSTYTGTPDDERIRELLLRAARDPMNPGLRVESIALLMDQLDTERVRHVFLQALAQDSNPGVRLKALEALRPYSGEDHVRRVFTRTLETDENPWVRIQAVEILSQEPDDELVGVLQAVVERDENRYVREQCVRTLRDMNASVGTF